MEQVDDTSSACISLGRRLGFEEEHCRQDAILAVRLFDRLADLHSLDDRSRDLLYYAGLLHDIGYIEGYWGHHKTAYRLIMQSDLQGLSDREKLVVANIARYHRGARPKLKHAGYAALDADDREAVMVLGAILRLADGLDRSHTDAVRDLEVWLEGDQLTVLVDCPDGCGSEVWAGEKKGRFLGDVLGLEVRVRERAAW
jgi:exopolyphosphatase/guanosine-5'-triphosphate,3'-diphosphate pyrophosphatase